MYVYVVIIYVLNYISISNIEITSFEVIGSLLLNNWLSAIEKPWRRKWKPTLVFLPGKSHGQRSLAGYRSLGCKELDMT